ncbi:HAD-IIIC family phosphatase [Rhodoferax saidenbachensis]|uniref:HAD-IIIC family phosphatase n=1 Tax=Rhodoferax saidenbachensis TaxID=1484693 RepID=A0A1P8KE67_9BURK|nr:HAD-IIIC family phosphatase [Rhodoferax saidenbachensis]APW44327.1 hypothetical protein RS694_18565 [Rhodoferax saidenbachensis]
MSQTNLAAVVDRLAARKPTPIDLSTCAEALAALAHDATLSGQPVRRVAVTGDLNVDLLGQAIACAIAQEGELPLVHLAPYGAMQQECLDPGSGLYRFQPDAVVLVPDWRQTLLPLPVDATAEAVAEATRQQVRKFEALWTALEARNCTIIQHLLVAPPHLPRGAAERRSPASAARRIEALNDALLEAGARRVTWIEADRFAAQVGLLAWSSPRFYYAGKFGFDPRFLPDYLPWFRGAWRAATGRAKKLLVLDLDDTLWGGTIGDDGLEGITLGSDHGPSGEAFAAWQQHIAALARRGLVLAVCSKNAPELAAIGFDHASSALRREDFAAFICSWDDKASGLQQIAEALCLGLDAMVFVDDNPAERLLVRQQLPQVEVIDIGGDPAQFIDRLEAGHWFDLQSYTDADFHRSTTYAARSQAQIAQAEAPDLASYLRALEMVGRLAPALQAELPRLAQLELKTNQFNVTTRRYSQTQLAAFMQQPDRLVLSLHLKDRFGDHGLIGTLIAVREDNVLRIDSWLLSCRVFSRTAEQFMLAGLMRWAQQQGATSLLGEYIPTARNAVVADLYARLGFTATGADKRFWQRDLAAPPHDLHSFISAEPAPSSPPNTLVKDAHA